MNVFIPFEVSGKVRQAFRDRGHNAWSCDIQEPDDGSNYHLQGDYRKFVNYLPWDIMIAFPVCTAVCVSGNGTYAGTEAREQGVQDFIEVYNLPIEKKCLENPVGVISTRFMKPTQYVQPWMFGHKECKKTGLWLVGLPKLKPTNIVGPPLPHERKDWEKVWRMAPSETRSKDRAETNQGLADAMAEQWG